MKSILTMALIIILISCGQIPNEPDPISKTDPSKVVLGVSLDTTSVKSAPDMPTGVTSTIKVTYAAIECECPQWVETKYRNVPYLQGIEHFYLAPLDSNLVNANKLWDGMHLPLDVMVTGRFSESKEIPATYIFKGIPEKARIFWYKKIKVLQSSYYRDSIQ